MKIGWREIQKQNFLDTINLWSYDLIVLSTEESKFAKPILVRTQSKQLIHTSLIQATTHSNIEKLLLHKQAGHTKRFLMNKNFF